MLPEQKENFLSKSDRIKEAGSIPGSNVHALAVAARDRATLPLFLYMFGTFREPQHRKGTVPPNQE
jgi:hypothetical protein